MTSNNRFNNLTVILLMAIVVTGISLPVTYGNENQLAKVTFYVA